MSIQTLEIDPNALVTGEEVRDVVLALPDKDRGIIITRPIVGAFTIVAINGIALDDNENRKVEVEYDDVAEV